MPARQVQLPYNFTPRPYQLPTLQALDSGILRAVDVWHRRSGKDKTAVNFTAKKMMQRVGAYYYFLPTYQQGKKIIWDGIDKDGFKVMDHFPEALVAKKNDSDMKLTYQNGSLFQVVGTDKWNSIMGTNPIGTVWSEYSLQNPMVWDYIRPILLENGGWALFLYTPRGHNHGFKLYNMALTNPDWFAEKLTILDTGVITPEQVEKEIAEGMDPDLAQQEYYCSFEGAMQGSYYGKHMQAARDEDRIGQVPYDEAVKVSTAWDLGIGDTTPIWFFQEVGQEIHLIDYYENSGEGLHHYAKVLQDKPYLYDRQFAPHDIQARELGTGKSRLEVAQQLGINFQVVPKLSVEEGIDAVRRMFNKCWFDEKKCERGIDALLNYSKEYDEDNKCWKQRPKHDWASHGADAFRGLALGRREGQIRTYMDKEEQYGYGHGQESFDPSNPFPQVGN